MDMWGWFLFLLLVPAALRLWWRSTKKKLFGKPLIDKVAVVTGASSGIGKAVAKELFKHGCKLVLCSRDLEALENLKRELLTTVASESAPRMPTVLKLDLADERSIDIFVRNLLDVYPDGPDILINSAGISHRSCIFDTAMSVHRKVMQINFFGIVQLISALLPKMTLKSQGHIVNVSSIQGLMSLPRRSAYSSSKHALQSFSDSLRIEMMSQGLEVKVTVVSPGYVNTNLSRSSLTGSGELYGLMDRNTLNGYEPKYVAEEIVTSIFLEEEEIVIAGYLSLSMIYIRMLLPSLYFKIMAIRDGNHRAARIIEILFPIFKRAKALKND